MIFCLVCSHDHSVNKEKIKNYIYLHNYIIIINLLFHQSIGRNGIQDTHPNEK